MDALTKREKLYKSLNKTPLRILVYLGTPIVLPHNGIHLDSLLTNVVAKELFGHDVDRWQEQDKQVSIPLPLKKTEGKYPIWKASIAFTSKLTREFQDFWNRKTQDQFSGYVSSKIVWPAGVISDSVSKSLAKEVRLEKPTGPAANSASGGFKSYFEKRNLLSTDFLIFHAYGNAKEAKRLLEQIEGIGKKTAIGFGKVTKVEVFEIEQDYSLFTPDHEPARSLPADDFPNLHAQIIASPVEPPYWSKRNLVIQFAPEPIPEWKWDIKEKDPTFEERWFDDELDENTEEEWFD